jgi:hypothetical protein
MGKELVYCYKCGTRLSDGDFSSGLAFRVGYHTTCERCADELLIPLSPEERQAVLNPDRLPAPERLQTARRRGRRTG